MAIQKKSTVSRRQFIKTAGAGAALVALPVSQATAQGAQTNWTMVTSWPPNFPILQTGAERFANLVRTMSGGRLDIQVFAAGELVPALGGLDAVSSGTVQASQAASYYWAGTIPAAQFFTAVPFGFTFDQMMDFLFAGGGLELWESVYDPFGLVPIPLITTSMQMGGWFRKEINSVDDLQGLKMRIPGLGGRVMAKAGVNVQLLPGGEIFTALQTGTIDATEWVGPFHDRLLGFPQVAKFYYHPGWHEPGTTAEFMVSQEAWNAISPELQQIVRSAAADVTNWSFAQFEAENAKAIGEILTEFPDVQLRRFPDAVLARLRELTTVVFDEESTKDAEFARVREAVDKFSSDLNPWSEISIESYLPAIN